MKWKLLLVMFRKEILEFLLGDQVSNGRDMYYVYMFFREGMLENMGIIYIEFKWCVQVVLYILKMYNLGVNVLLGCLVQKV